ncbi:hypothetical protein BSL78_21258 [Apostichopus japonicus]|uniref:Uncharacterized protein n=1 Tax=Stichopus japonicus TaxID=307972 RepID=A0A2G8K1L5_STIJA|nr:hypothetical protein BSL78_21258 [Apostichopus japonicus]
MDNLAAHQLGGFQQHFHAGRICRFCMASSNDIQDHFDSSSLIERTSVGHKHQVQLVMENQGLRHVYGVASKSVLSDLQYFDVISCLPPDPAHDLLEGLVPELMTKVVTTFIQDGFFTLESFNSALKLFPFGKSDQKSKPTCNTTANLGSFKIKQTASQTWCLMRLLPLIIGSSIPEGNEYWELFLSLMDICEITFAPSIPCEMVAYLEYLVHGFLVALKELFPEDRIKPKSHYLLHYPRSILKYGPLVHCWTMSEALKRYHVTYGSRKRVFLCSASDVEPEIKSQFGIKKFRLQVFDKDFDDWVDIDGDIEEEQMEDKAVKLNVIGERDEVACLSASSFTSSSSSDDTIILAGNERDVPCTSDVSDSFHEEEKFLPWPNKFELHQDDVRRDILVELLKGGPVSNRIKSAVIQATFDKMCLFTVYPTTDQYNTAAKAVIKSFPNLAIKLPFCEPYDALKNALKDKFRNERRHMTRDVVVKKRKTSTHATTDEGERKEELIGLYLRIIEDFSAIISWDAVSEMFYKNLDDIAAKIITYNTNHSKGTLRFLVEYNNFIQQLTEKDKRDATWTAALWILPGFLKEDRNFLFINSDDDVSSDVEINTPVITYTGDPLDPSNITIIAENEKYSTAASFPRAVLILLATYYVFNIQYNGKVKGTLTFLQKVLLQCKDKGKLPQKIISLIAKLQA